MLPKSPIDVGLVAAPSGSPLLEPRHDVGIQPKGDLLLDRPVEVSTAGMGPVQNFRDIGDVNATGNKVRLDRDGTLSRLRSGSRLTLLHHLTPSWELPGCNHSDNGAYAYRDRRWPQPGQNHFPARRPWRLRSPKVVYVSLQRSMQVAYE